MDELISRRQAIDVIDKEQKENDVSDVSAMYAYSKCKTIIKQLPSALSTNLAEVGTDCISRQQAIKTVGWYSCHSGDELLFADNALRQLPSAQPKIIQCRDCRYYNSEEKECLDLMGHGRRWEEDDFCSYAERREVTT